MRVLMLTHNMAGLGGTYLRAYSLAVPLVAMGHEVTLLASAAQPTLRTREMTVHGVRIIQMGGITPARVRHGGLDPFDGVRRVQHVHAHAYDIVHGFDHRGAVSLPALWARLIEPRIGGRRVPFVSDWADLWGMGGIADTRSRLAQLTLGLADHVMERRVRRYADGVTVISDYLLEQARALGVPREAIRLVQVGANADMIEPLDAAAMRRKFGVAEDAPTLVHVGFVPYDVELLADTFILLARENPRMRLLMAGAPTPLLHTKVAQAGVQDQVRHVGVVPYAEMQQLLACGDVMLLPLSNRTINVARFPNRFGDYLAAGRPLATNLTGEVGKIVVNENIGVATADNPSAFAAAIAALLADPDRRAQMGTRARQLAEGRYSWCAMAQEVDALYHAVCQGAA